MGRAIQQAHKTSNNDKIESEVHNDLVAIVVEVKNNEKQLRSQNKIPLVFHFPDYS